jgi:AcrR family transcriptional regulator
MTEASTRLRADARRNRDRVVEAARSVFAERGLEATVAEIASRARVGKATVYRSFPTREDLLAAVALDRLEWFEDRLRRALDEPDVGSSLSAYIADVFDRLRGDLGLAAALRSLDLPATREAAGRIRQLGNRLVARSLSAGAVRPDLTVGDLRLLLVGLSQSLAERCVTDRASWQRAAELTMAAVRPQSPPS